MQIKINLTLFVTALLLAFSCTNTPKAIPAPTPPSLDMGYYTLAGDSVVIPAVTIVLELSEKAEQRLKSKETIIVDATYSGVPITDTLSESYQQMGQILVAEAQKELTTERTVRIENVKFAKSVYNDLKDKDVELLINIYSGRKSSPDNLLSSDIISDKMSVLKDKSYTLKCKLIEED
jgi:hypothetical protein